MAVQKDIYERKIMTTVFIFKKGLFWLAWVYTQGEPAEQYYDNNKTIVYHNAGIKYLSITFTQKRAFKNIERYLQRTGQLDESPES